MLGVAGHAYSVAEWNQHDMMGGCQTVGRLVTVAQAAACRLAFHDFVHFHRLPCPAQRRLQNRYRGKFRWIPPPVVDTNQGPQWQTQKSYSQWKSAY